MKSSPLQYDHYKVLGVERTASSIRIKQAFRERVKQCHPDRDNSSGAHVRFLIVHEAYAVLIDPERRLQYNARLAHYHPASEKPYRQQVRRKPSVDHGPADTREGRVPQFAFYGLHLTGLLFGTGLISGVLIGLVFFEWPTFTLLFCIPGIAVIPDSIEGLRM